ncbi:MAG: maleylacetoacetate isomerase [Burkholderiaceae bacterium]
MQLYTYFRSSAAYRVRIALNLKGLAFEPRVVWLPAGEHSQATYRQTNPQALVPTLIDGEHTISQSLAIIEYLDETQTGPALMPATAAARAQVRSLSQAIACDIHPLNNLRILKYLKNELGHDQETVDTWYRHWCDEGLAGLEQALARLPKQTFAFGESPGLMDICLVPQVFNARRFKVDMSRYPTIERIDAACNELAAFTEAAPGAQPEASDPRLG